MTGEIGSKTAAGEYALKVFDERWHRIVREALRIRNGGPPLYRNPLRRRSDLLAYMTMVLESETRGERRGTSRRP
ncbi:hypothetical protein AB0395_10780 [Streptosporangium sp. NPDC051023]|uniref:hypothetical protein n=1 Tax=Streptosporangium sp. NPDC051023 TaxID=3155410 RepID=UPI00344F9F6B